jgi:flagellar protein FliS
MVSGSAVNIYQQNSIKTASKEKLLLMLYEGLVRFLKIAIIAIDEKNIEKANTYLKKSQAIIAELMGSLNMEEGGEIAQSLMLMYDYLFRRIVEANLKKDKAIAEEVLRLSEELKEAFEQAYALVKKQ